MVGWLFIAWLSLFGAVFTVGCMCLAWPLVLFVASTAFCVLFLLKQLHRISVYQAAAQVRS